MKTPLIPRCASLAQRASQSASPLVRSPAQRSVSALSSALLSVLCLSAGVVSASPALYHLGAMDQLLPFSASERGGGASVAAFNPAGLTWSHTSTGSSQSVGLSLTHQALTLRYLPRPEGSDLPTTLYELSPVAGARTYKPLPTSSLPARGLDEGEGEQLYLTLAYQTRVLSELSLGVYALLPLHRFELQAPGYVDERAQYFGNKLGFERWGDALEGLSSAAALAYELTEGLSVGGGVNLSTSAVAQSDVFLGDVNYSGVSYVAPRVEVNTSVSPYASLEGRLLRGRHTLSLNVSAHAPESSEVEGVGEVQVWGFPYPEGQESLPQRFKQVYRMLPWRGRAGLSWREEVSERAEGGSHAQSLTRGLALGVGWAQWSAYLNRAGESASWSDQWEVSGGAWAPLGPLMLGLDLRWRPSPVPEQIGRTSYIDPSALASALSVSWRVNKRLSLKAQAQVHRLMLRRDLKDPRALSPVVDELPTSWAAASSGANAEVAEESVGLQTNNPGYPGYESEGWVWVSSIGVSVEL